MLRWMKQSWDLVTPEIIQKSFLKCGISNALDGTEDDLFNTDSDDEDPFEGFTQHDVEDAEEVQYNIDIIPELDSSENEEDEDEYEEEEEAIQDPGSPGH